MKPNKAFSSPRTSVSGRKFEEKTFILCLLQYSKEDICSGLGVSLFWIFSFHGETVEGH